MTRILVVYGTTDGQTRKVALALGIALRGVGADADVFPASPDAPDPSGYAGVIVAASLHAGKFQRPVRKWIERHAVALADKTTAFMAVGLMARSRSESVRQKLLAIMSDFAHSCGWKPAYLKPVAGALRYTRYGWLKRWVVKRMAARFGGDTDTSRDHEYTNWASVRAFAQKFVAAVSNPGGSSQAA